MSGEARRSSCHSGHNEPPNPSTSTSFFNLSIPPLRRGFDLRRPIMSQPRRDVIDLTEDTSSPPHAQVIPPAPLHLEGLTATNRPPRFDRNIIHIDDEEDNIRDPGGESPEIEFLTSRPRSRSLSASRRLARRSAIAPVGVLTRRPQVAVRVTAGERNPSHLAGWADALQTLQFPRPFHSNFGRGHDELVEWEGDLQRGLFQAPNIHLNFSQAGFNYEQPSRPQPRLPTYEPPPSAPAGFTRSPGEDELLVCPHCDDELGVSNDEVKRQVWVVKTCGHVGNLLLHNYQRANMKYRSTVENAQGTER
jgi:hypothetical protein